MEDLSRFSSFDESMRLVNDSKTYSPCMLFELVNKVGHRLDDVRDRAIRAICEKIMNKALRKSTLISLAEKFDFPFLVLHWVNDRYNEVPRTDLRALVLALSVAATEEESIRRRLSEAGAVSFWEQFLVHEREISDKSSLLIEVERLLNILTGVKTPRTHIEQNSISHLESTHLEDIPKSARQESVVPAPPSLCLSPSEEQRLFDFAVRIKFSKKNDLLTALRDFLGCGFYEYSCEVFKYRPAVFEALISKINEQNSPQRPLWGVLGKVIEKGGFGGTPFLLAKLCLTGIAKDLYPAGICFDLLTQVLQCTFSPEEGENIWKGAVSDIIRFQFSGDSYERGGEYPLVREWTIRKRFCISALSLLVNTFTISSSNSMEIASHLSDWLKDPRSFSALGHHLLSLVNKFALILGSDFKIASTIAEAVNTELEKKEPKNVDDHFLNIFTFVSENLNAFEPTLVLERMVQFNASENIFALAATLGDNWMHKLKQFLPHIFANGKGQTFLLSLADYCQHKSISLISEEFNELTEKDILMKEWIDTFVGDGRGNFRVYIRNLFNRSDTIRRQTSLLLWKDKICDLPGTSFSVDPLENVEELETLFDRLFSGKKFHASNKEIHDAVAIACNPDIPTSLRRTSADQAMSIWRENNKWNEELQSDLENAFLSQNLEDGLENRIACLLVLGSSQDTNCWRDDFLIKILGKVYTDKPRISSMAVLWAYVFPNWFVGLNTNNASQFNVIGKKFVAPVSDKLVFQTFHKLTDNEKRLLNTLLQPQTSSYILNDNCEDSWFANPQISLEHEFISSLLKSLEICPPVWEQCESILERDGPAEDNEFRFLDRLMVLERVKKRCEENGLKNEFIDKIQTTFLSSSLQAFSVAIQKHTLRSSAVSPKIIANWIHTIANVTDELSCEWERVGEDLCALAPKYPEVGSAAIRLLEKITHLSVTDTLFDFFLVGGSSSRISLLGALWLIWRNLSRADDSNSVIIGRRAYPISTVAGVVGKFIDESFADEIIGYAWGLLAKLAHFGEICENSVPSTFLVRAADCVLSDSLNISYFGASDFLAVALRKTRQINEERASFVHDRLLAAIGSAYFWEKSASVDPYLFLTARIRITAALASVNSVEVARTLVLTERWTYLFKQINDSDGAEAVGELASSCISKDAPLIVYLGNCELFSALKFSAKLTPALCLIVQTAATYSLTSTHLESAWVWLTGDAFLKLLTESLNSADSSNFQNACLVVTALGVFNSIGRDIPSKDNIENIFQLLIPQLSDETAVNALTAIIRRTSLSPKDLIALNAVAKTALQSNQSNLLVSQIRLIGSWAAQNTRTSESFADWFGVMWRRWENSEIASELLDAFAEILKAHPKLTGLNSGLAFLLASCTKRSCSFALLQKSLSVCVLAKELLINKAATGRVITALFAAHGKYDVKTVPKDTQAFARLGALLAFVASMTACKQSTDAFLNVAEDMVDVSELTGSRFPVDNLILALLNCCACDDSNGKRIIVNSSKITSLIERHSENCNINAQIALAICQTVRRVKTCE